MEYILKKYELILLRADCATDFTKDILIDENTGWKLKSQLQTYVRLIASEIFIITRLCYCASAWKKNKHAYLPVLFCQFLGDMHRIPQHNSQ